MDLPGITDLQPARSRADLGSWQAGDAWLAGGSWLFSEPQPDISRLIDLTTMGWPALTVTERGLEIAATCTIAELAATASELPPEWPAATLITQCCNALLGSFKVWNVATVGGNVCLGLPAGPMTSLTAALDGVATVWQADGQDRAVTVTELVVDAGRTGLRPGDVVRSISLPAAALGSRTAFRQYSLSNIGRTAVLAIGRRGRQDGSSVFTVTASTRRPVQLRFGSLPSGDALLAALDAAGPVYYDDVHGDPRWRAELTRRALTELRDELAGGEP